MRMRRREKKVDEEVEVRSYLSFCPTHISSLLSTPSLSSKLAYGATGMAVEGQCPRELLAMSASVILHRDVSVLLFRNFGRVDHEDSNIPDSTCHVAQISGRVGECGSNGRPVVDLNSKREAIRNLSLTEDSTQIQDLLSTGSTWHAACPSHWLG